MLTLTGTLRQSGEITIKEKPFVKLWVEHESERDNGPADLQILELLVPVEAAGKLPKKGEQISVDCRCYANGREVRFSALAVRPVALTSQTPGNALVGALGAK